MHEHKDRGGYMRKYNKEHSQQIKEYHLLKKYGITMEEYNRMFDEQDGRCLICHKHQIELSRCLCVDHNHLTGKIRGLLCTSCNYLVGVVEANVTISDIYEYLKKEQL